MISIGLEQFYTLLFFPIRMLIIKIMAIQFDREKIKTWVDLDSNYKLNDKMQLGKGAFGIVFQGYSLKKDTLIAIKAVKSTSDTHKQIQTLRALSSLDHQNIMGYYGDLTKDQNTYLFIEYCNNGTLTEAINKGLSQLQVLKYFREIVEGMCYMNARGKMHRDLKPDNILIGPQKDIKISDFGLSQTSNSIFVTGFRGTAIYAGPQVFFKSSEDQVQYTSNCDVWSAGLILYQMLVGQRFFKKAHNYLQLKEQWLKCERGLDKVSLGSKFHPLWEYFINKMLQFDYKKRPNFHQILINLKRVYSRMKQTIQTGKNMIQELQLNQVSLYINYNITKHQILLDICQKFTKQDFPLKNQYKYVCMFLAIIRYVLFFKDFIRNLRYRRLKLDNDHDLLLNKHDIAQVQFFCDRNRFTLQHRYQFYSKQLKENIAKRIIEVYCSRKQSQSIMDNLNQSVEIIKNYHRGQFIDNSQELCQVFKSVGNIIKKKFQNKKLISQSDLKLYSYLMLAILIENKFPQNQYNDQRLHKQLQQITNNNYFNKLTNQQLLKFIQQMQQQLSK